ncbi:MAG: helix-turn-helix transcriptional regulator [Umezawaea sp.]
MLSREQVYRLVIRPPQRLSMDILVALCNIVDWTPNDLIKPEVVNAPVRKTSGEGDAGHAPPLGGPSPRPAMSSPATAQARASDLAAARHQLVAAVRAATSSVTPVR